MPSVPRPLVSPHSLTWGQVDPRTHPFEPSTVVEVVRALPPASHVPPARGAYSASTEWQQWDRTFGLPWTTEMGDAIVDHYGAWASGWQWGRGESDVDGGPVASWCCAGHSISTPAATLDAVAAGLVEWRLWLEALQETFDAYLPMPFATANPEAVDLWERATVRLVTMVAMQTEAMSAWFAHCRQVLEWFLTAAGVGTDRARHLVAEATEGRFDSWVEPGPVRCSDMGRSLGSLVVHDERE